MNFRISHIAQGLDGLRGQPHHGKRLLIAPGALNRLVFIKPPAEAVLDDQESIAENMTIEGLTRQYAIKGT
jgi:hypothetical protein